MEYEKVLEVMLKNFGILSSTGFKPLGFSYDERASSSESGLARPIKAPEFHDHVLPSKPDSVVVKPKETKTKKTDKRASSSVMGFTGLADIRMNLRELNVSGDLFSSFSKLGALANAFIIFQFDVFRLLKFSFIEQRLVDTNMEIRAISSVSLNYAEIQYLISDLNSKLESFLVTKPTSGFGASSSSGSASSNTASVPGGFEKHILKSTTSMSRVDGRSVVEVVLDILPDLCERMEKTAVEIQEMVSFVCLF